MNRLINLGRFLLYLAVSFVVLTALQMYAFVRIENALHIAPAFRAALEPRTEAISEVILLISVIIATSVPALTERRPFWVYGFARSPEAAPRYLEGVAYGVAAAGAVGLFMYGLGGFKISGFALHGSDWITYPVLWLIVMLLVGFTEELGFRGYPLYALSRVVGFCPAAIVMTALFGLAHVSKPGENPVDIASVVFIGLFLCFTLWRTGSLWLAAGFHFAFDYMQFFVIGTRNGTQMPMGHLFNATFPGPAWVNGGALGTEASYFIFPVTAVLFAVVNVRHPRRRFTDVSPPLPQRSRAL